jgi:hypothetical protein
MERSDIHKPPRREDPSSATRHHKTGLNPLFIGAQRLIDRGDGVLRYYTVGSRDSAIATAKREGRVLKIKVLEFSTGMFFESVEEMRAAFPDPVTMKLTGKIAQWAYWSADLMRASDAKEIELLDRKIAGRKKLIADLEKRISNVDNVKASDEATVERDAEIKNLAKDEEDRKTRAENIVGLLSDTLHPADLPPEPLNAA